MKELIGRKLIGAEKFNNFAILGAKALFEGINTVAGFLGVWQALNTIKIVSFEVIFDGVLYHVPLDGVLGVVFFHIFRVATGEEIDNFIAVSDEHGSTERNN